MTLYAGNSLTGAIYKGSELICQTGGGEGDITVDFGNEMLRANAWTSHTNGRGKLQFFYTKGNAINATDIIVSELFDVSSTILTNPARLYLYPSDSISFLNDDGVPIKLTANTSNNTFTVSYPTGNSTYTGFAHASFDTTSQAIRNNKFYTSGSNAINNKSAIENVTSFSVSENGTYPCIINNKLYIGGNLDSSHVWQRMERSNTNTNAWFGIADNRITYTLLSTKETILSTFNVDLEKINLSKYIFWQDSTIYRFTYNTTNGIYITKQYTFTNNVNIKKAISYSNYTWVLLENNDLYTIYQFATANNPTVTKKASNIANICYSPYSSTNNGAYMIVVDTSNNMKILYGSNTTTVNVNNMLNITPGNNYVLYPGLYSSNSMGYSRWYVIYYTDDYDITSSIYTTPNNPTYAYYDKNIGLNKNTITSISGNELICNGITYIRDGQKDSLFNFIPDEFENRLYTDQDIALTAMTAALRYR